MFGPETLLLLLVLDFGQFKEGSGGGASWGVDKGRSKGDTELSGTERADVSIVAPFVFACACVVMVVVVATLASATKIGVTLLDDEKERLDEGPDELDPAAIAKKEDEDDEDDEDEEYAGAARGEDPPCAGERN